MLFKDVAGQEKIKHKLMESHLADRTAHAQIFNAKEGSGGLALALAYAQYLLCENPQATDACGQCSACKKTQKLIHPDLHFSYPTVGSKTVSTDFITEWRAAILENPYISIHDWLITLNAENKQGNISVSECVSIVQRLSYKAIEGKYRILILWLPEFLGAEGNRLLKLIEEPRPNTIFLLVTENVDKILNTILSRCQLIQLNQLSDEEIILKLMTDHALDRSRAENIGYLADGNYHQAIKLMHNTEDLNADLFVYWLRVCYLGKAIEMVQWVEGMASGKHPEKDCFFKMGRKDQVFFLKYGLFFFREFLKLKTDGSGERVRLKEKESAVAKNLLKLLDVSKISKLSLLFDEMIYHIERNGNAKLIFMDASIKMHKVLQAQHVLVG